MKAIKTDQEIKEFIDSREALTRRELYLFIKNKPRYSSRSVIWKWWDYVLQTKDAIKLKEYAKYKVNVYGKKTCVAYSKFKEAYQSDERINKAGKLLGAKLLNTLYGVKISPCTFLRYKKKLTNESRTT